MLESISQRRVDGIYGHTPPGAGVAWIRNLQRIYDYMSREAPFRWFSLSGSVLVGSGSWSWLSGLPVLLPATRPAWCALGAPRWGPACRCPPPLLPCFCCAAFRAVHSSFRASACFWVLSPPVLAGSVLLSSSCCPGFSTTRLRTFYSIFMLRF